MWESIKRFFTDIFEGLGEAGQYLITGVGVIILVVGSILIAQQWTKNTQKPNSDQEVAQGPNASIGEALSPDVNIEIVEDPDKDKTIGQSQANSEGQTIAVENSEVSENSKNSGEVKTTQTETYFISPATGLDPNKPISYTNNDLGFKLTLPAGAQVIEKGSSVEIYTKDGTLLANITTVDTTDSLSDVKAQLSFSPEISSLKDSSLANQSALQYSVKNLTGYAVKNNNRLFYLTGQNDILSKFSL